MRSPLLLSTTLWAARLYSSKNLPAGWTEKLVWETIGNRAVDV